MWKRSISKGTVYKFHFSVLLLNYTWLIWYNYGNSNINSLYLGVIETEIVLNTGVKTFFWKIGWIVTDTWLNGWTLKHLVPGKAMTIFIYMKKRFMICWKTKVQTFSLATLAIRQTINSERALHCNDRCRA